MNTKKIDLNIENYNLDDILNLFKLPLHFDEHQLKQAKKVVLMIHPDKSGLDKEYFFFYSKAYKVLYSIYTFKNKSIKTSSKTSLSKLVEEDSELENQHRMLDQFFNKNKDMKDPKEFNKWFNKQFETHKNDEEPGSSGYGDWLKTDEAIYKTEQTTQSNMNKDFDNHKKQIKSLIVYNGITDIYSTGINSSLLGELQDNFSSGMFSQLQYQDIKQAHTETIIPVSEDDFHNIKKFNGVEEYKRYRNSQQVNPLNESQSLEYLTNSQKTQETESTQRAYYYAKQLEEADKKKKQFWGNLQHLTNV